jgi:hypothetical protein
MALSFRGKTYNAPKITQTLSENLLKPAKPKDVPAEEPNHVLSSPAERKAAMNGLNAVEVKWAKAGLVMAALTGGLLTIYLSSAHPTRKETVTHHGKKFTETVPISATWLLIGAIVLGFCALGFYALRKRKRTMVAFTFFVCGFSFTLIFAPLGFALIALGGWLMLRAYRIQKFGTPNAKMAAREAAARPPRRERKAAANAPAKPTGYKPPTSNKRYTPKAPARKKVAKPVE